MKYNHRTIEKKWQAFWLDKKIFASEIDPKRPKYYILDMFPYPSGAGLHVGHITGYTGTDILARYKRQKGFNVLHPMGWDSFGLPAEQFAIRTGTHPALTSKKNIDTYRRQLQSLGFSYDWDREITTSDPSYYKWTQWIFTKLFEKGLAYEAQIHVNYCPFLGTVLANEEVENGRAKEGGYPVERRPLKQWVLKITAYAERLLADLDLLDWPEHLKKLQANWIGKSEGALITFVEEASGRSILVYTTRPDTLYGASYLVLAPEHPLVKKITPSDREEEVFSYIEKAQQKGDLERTDLAKEKTGIWTGSYAYHPLTKEKIPIWIADYVLMGYGTGAIMAVAAHDERDFAFAKEYKLPILPVYDPGEGVEEREEVLAGKCCWTKEGTMIHSGSFDGSTMLEAKEKMIRFLEENAIGKRSVQYKLRDWLFSRQRYWGEPIPILHFEDGSMRALGIDELPLTPPDLEDFKPEGTGKSPLAKKQEWVEIEDPKTKKPCIRETNTMPQWAGSCWYYLRFCDPKNAKEAWGKKAENYWMPVDMYVGGVEHAVLHLLYARFWHKVLFDCGFVHSAEPFMTLRNQGLVTAPSYKKKEGGYLPEEETREKNGEVFSKKSGEKLLVQIEKMSKSKLNGITPDEIIEEFGADSLRLYEMFMGPFEKEKLWNTEALSGCKRFLNRFYDMAHSSKVQERENEEAYKLTHRLIDAIGKDIEALAFNTAIASMMEYLNKFIPLPIYPKICVKWAIQALYPFAPHIAEELWQHLGEKNSIAYEPFPKADAKYLVDDQVLYVIQVNGRLRARFALAKGLSEAKILSIAQESPEVKKHLSQGIKKVIFVPDKLLNIVV